MLSFDASWWAVIMVPALVITGYVTWRGMVSREFREPGRSGWYRHDMRSPEYWGGTLVNLLMLSCFAFLAYESLFNWSRYTH